MDPFGINKLIDLLVQFFWWFVPCKVINHFEAGVVLRFGRYARTLYGGFHWIWPFGIEEVFSLNTKPDGGLMKTQVITLKDGTSLAVTIITVWEVTDIKQLILEIEDKETVLTWALGTIEDFIQRYTWDELMNMRKWAADSGKRYGLAEKLLKHVNDVHEKNTGVHFTDIRIRDFCMTGLQ
jgi:regulator of protease activity HflC (stomatin/prohibitin superfamily)